MKRVRLWLLKTFGMIDMGCHGCCMTCKYYERCESEAD